MAACGPDIVSVDGSVDLNDAIKRVGPGFAFQVGPKSFLAHHRVSVRVAADANTRSEVSPAASVLLSLLYSIRNKPQQCTREFIILCRATWTRGCCLARRRPSSSG